MPDTAPTPTPPFDELEQAYEARAQAIDRAGPHNEAVFLAKLALTLGQQLGSVAPFKEAIAMALQDLPARGGAS